eukprot:scaffold5398_cov120-Cylindrotheca_fusiformis.AAC.2
MSMSRRCKRLSLVVLLLLLSFQKHVYSLSNDQKTPCLQVVSTKRNGGHTRTFVLDDGSSIAKYSSGQKGLGGIQNLQSALRSTFLPSGYPTRTPPGYLRYSIWSWIQDLSTQLRSVLATQRVLEGVGVGREGATALSALMNYLIRDGCGMAATLLFTSGWSSKFRTDVKRWRLFADTILDVGITCEVAAVLVPRTLFLPMISIGNICKSICGVAAGACGGSINLHWAKGSDISDINAKFGAQHTCTGALGLVFAAVFARSVNQTRPLVLWGLYFLLTFLHIFANARCMRLISFDSCNNARLNMLLSDFFLGNLHHDESQPRPEMPALPTPKEIAMTEPLFFGVPGKHRTPPTTIPIRFGVDFGELYESSKGSVLTVMQNGELRNDTESYVLSSGYSNDRKQHCVLVAFLANASPIEETKAYFHATLLGLELQKKCDEEKGGVLNDQTRHAVERDTKEVLDIVWETFRVCSSTAGWDLNKTELRSEGYELVVNKI